MARSVTWRIGDRLVTVPLPAVMGVLNATPDSFHAASRRTGDEALHLAERMLEEGAAILDIGGASSRPGAAPVDPEEERRRVTPQIEAVHRRFPEALISVDTTWASVARDAVAAGAGLVNDISAGLTDPDMLAAVAALKVPYVAMHMQGAPPDMQAAPTYADVVREVTYFLSERLRAAHEAGIADVVLDPGFGFGKTTAHNFALLRELERITLLGAPVLVGLSRKRMINETLGTTAAEALNGTTVLNTLALHHRAALLRVHDVREAVQAVRLIAACGC